MAAQWEYEDFVYKYPDDRSLWCANYPDAEAQLYFWQASQKYVFPQLQKKVDEGWEPLSEIWPSAISIRTFRSRWWQYGPVWQAILVIIWLNLTILTLGLALWFPNSTIWCYSVPTQFLVKLRRSKDRKANRGELSQSIVDPSIRIRELTQPSTLPALPPIRTNGRRVTVAPPFLIIVYTVVGLAPVVLGFVSLAIDVTRIVSRSASPLNLDWLNLFVFGIPWFLLYFIQKRYSQMLDRTFLVLSLLSFVCWFLAFILGFPGAETVPVIAGDVGSRIILQLLPIVAGIYVIREKRKEMGIRETEKRDRHD